MSMSELDPTQSAALIAELHAQFTRQFGSCKKFETHISYVLLAGDNAYKFKKPVNLGFLNFSTRALRHDYCEREVALNHRYAPQLYWGVLALVRGPQGLALGAAGDPLDYAVWMCRFADGARLDERLEAGSVDGLAFADLGKSIGEMHLHAPRPFVGSRYGSAELSVAQMLAGLEPLRDVAPTAAAVLDPYRVAVGASTERLAARLREGFIRDCHGDLHLSNIVHLDGRWVPFDCIEFNDELRYIDTLSDFAFVKMDLDLRGTRQFSNILLNAYLSGCGDYTGLNLLRLYCAYRSLVRAKVAGLASVSLDGSAQAEAIARSAQHLTLAGEYLAAPPPPSLLITYGASGSGKSWRSQGLATAHGYIHLRSDIERRRLAGRPVNAVSGSQLNGGIYAGFATEATYQRLKSLAETALNAGYSVIVDATFLEAAQRAAFRALARQLKLGFGILACDAPEDVLRARIDARHAAGGDPSEATQDVLTQQLAARELLSPAERAEIVEEAL